MFVLGSATVDAHWDLKGNHGLHSAETDKPLAGLIKDLKSRGMFGDVLIVWHGEFGRLPISERMDGRDHNNKGFSVWLVGSGIKGGPLSARPTSTDTRRPRTRSRCTSSMPRSSTCSDSITSSSPTGSMDATCVSPTSTGA